MCSIAKVLAHASVISCLAAPASHSSSYRTENVVSIFSTLSSGWSLSWTALVWYIVRMNATIRRLASSCSDTCSDSESESDPCVEESESELVLDSESLLVMALQPKLCSSLAEPLVHWGAAAPSGPPAPAHWTARAAAGAASSGLPAPVEQQLLSAEQQPAPAEQQVEQLPLWSSSSLQSAGCLQPDTAVEALNSGIRAHVARLLFLSPSGPSIHIVL